MTILTKSVIEKKEKLIGENEELLIPNGFQDKVPEKPGVESNSTIPKQYVVLHTRGQNNRANRVSATTMVCVFLTSLLLLGMTIIGSIYLYRQMHHAKGWCLVPYPPAATEDIAPSYDALKTRNFFYEDMEFSPDLQSEELIFVPQNFIGRSAVYIHDFGRNLTTIVDKGGKRCFVIDLDRNHVFPPHSLLDVIRDMRKLDYYIDTELLTENVRVMLPPLSSLEGLGNEVLKRCHNLPTYKLQRIAKLAFKRSTNQNNNINFVEFAGNKIVQFSLVNSYEL